MALVGPKPKDAAKALLRVIDDVPGLNPPDRAYLKAKALRLIDGTRSALHDYSMLWRCRSEGVVQSLLDGLDQKIIAALGADPSIGLVDMEPCPPDEDCGKIQSVIQLDEASYDAVVQMLERPPEPNEALKKLFRHAPPWQGGLTPEQLQDRPSGVALGVGDGCSIDGSVFGGDPAAIYESLGGSGLPESLGGDGPVFTGLSDGDNPRGHVDVTPDARLHPPMRKADPELAQQAAEATRLVLNQKPEDPTEQLRQRLALLEEHVKALAGQLTTVENNQKDDRKTIGEIRLAVMRAR